MQYSQENRRIAISTPLGDNALLLREFTGSESISRLFQFELELLSDQDSIKFQDIVGKSATVRILDASGAERSWNGLISRFSQGAQDRRLSTYHAEMVPWLWFLTRTADCRIFQDKKVPEILEKVFTDLRFQDFEVHLYGEFKPREYCVQYRETDFNFVSRLMEEEGIYYYFRHEAKKHVLVLADDPVAHKPCPKQTDARYDFRGGGIKYEDVVTEWRYEEEFRPGSWSQTDYNFETPSANLAVTIKGKNAYEIYDFPGEHLVRADGDRLARIRLQEQTAAIQVHRGSSSCRHFSVGCKFDLKDHYRSDLNQSYLLTSVRHVATQGDDYGDAGGDTELTYQNTFECIPYSVPFRPTRSTVRPFVRGCQTAVVVGPPGEQIYTDKYGRVKVQFHWDREGKKDQNSSCWIRVSQSWGGAGWGGVFLPHVGQEVIVSFLEGDPDQPMIIGRVYNATQMPPLSLPASKTQSIIRDHGGNQIIMEGAAGSQKLHLYSPKHNTGMTLGNSISIFTDSDHKSNVGGNSTNTVVGNHNEQIGGNSTRKVSLDWNEVILGKRKIEVGGDLKQFFAGVTHRTFVGMISTLIGGIKHETVGGAELKIIRGAEVKNTKGVKSEVIAGSSFKHDKSTKYEVVGSAFKSKAPTLKQQIQSATYLLGEVIENVKQKKQQKIADELATKAASIKNTAEGEVLTKCNGMKMEASDALEIKANEAKTKATTAMVKASDYVIKADCSFNNGYLTIKK